MHGNTNVKLFATEFPRNNDEKEAQIKYIYTDQDTCISDLQKRIDHTLNNR